MDLAPATEPRIMALPPSLPLWEPTRTPARIPSREPTPTSWLCSMDLAICRSETWANSWAMTLASSSSVARLPISPVKIVMCPAAEAKAFMAPFLTTVTLIGNGCGGMAATSRSTNVCRYPLIWLSWITGNLVSMIRSNLRASSSSSRMVNSPKLEATGRTATNRQTRNSTPARRPPASFTVSRSSDRQAPHRRVCIR